jgi:hypothetical protein
MLQCYYAFEIIPNVWILRNDQLEAVWDEYWEHWFTKMGFKMGFYVRQKSISPFWKKKTEEMVRTHVFDWMFLPLPSMKKYHSDHSKQWNSIWTDHVDLMKVILETNVTQKAPIFLLCDDTLERSIYFMCGIMVQLGWTDRDKIQIHIQDYLPNEEDHIMFMDMFHQYYPMLMKLKKWKH